MNFVHKKYSRNHIVPQNTYYETPFIIENKYSFLKKFNTVKTAEKIAKRIQTDA